jgi:CDP-diacylglycerol--glycerol-3-phosphate 3-phosphatidyltransferase
MGITPNQITAVRVVMAFVAAALFGRSPWANLAALAITIGVIALDGVDGYIARRRNLATPLGAQLDILGDRVIENLYFTFFAACGLISWWVPVLFFLRGTLTDFIRALAVRSSRAGVEVTPFGKNSMLQSRWAQALVGSRASRAAYAALKCVCFCYLGLQLTLASGGFGALAAFAAFDRELLQFGAQILVAATVAFCLVRGLPVVWEGRRYLASLARPDSLGARAPSRAALASRRAFSSNLEP